MHWLESTQQACGGWGETCRSYDDPSLEGHGRADPLADGLGNARLDRRGQARSPAVARGIDYLIETQIADGSWDESTFTGTGFPRVFYLRYHFYRVYFPLMAICSVRRS